MTDLYTNHFISLKYWRENVNSAKESAEKLSV